MAGRPRRRARLNSAGARRNRRYFMRTGMQDAVTFTVPSGKTLRQALGAKAYDELKYLNHGMEPALDITSGTASLDEEEVFLLETAPHVSPAEAAQEALGEHEGYDYYAEAFRL